MIKEKNFCDSVLTFYEFLSHYQFNLPKEFRVINPFGGEAKDTVKKITTAFYHKYYNDNKPRRIILGSSPARRGTALTGVPFEDASHLRNELGIEIDNFYVSKSSSNFLYDVIRCYGGYEKFYSNFLMSFVCPLGIVRVIEGRKEVNANYYESEQLKKELRDFIVLTLKKQIEFGVDTSICYCIGSGENYRFLLEINSIYKFFKKIIPLEHPRFIMQYNSNKKEIYLEKYLNALEMTD